MDMLLDLTQSIASEISSIESRTRKRSADSQNNFEHAIRNILSDFWKASAISPQYECGMNKRPAYYSENPRYRDPNLTFKQTMAAFDGLIALDMIEVTRNGFFDRETGNGGITKYRAKDRLLELVEGIEGNPFTDIKPDLGVESIILRDSIDGVRTVIDYEDDAATNGMRSKLRIINACLAKHWPDIRIKDEDYSALQERLLLDDAKQPVDFTQRILTRIFSNGRFDHGGRFYRAWWHNVPSEYRKFITIDGKRTCEYDYSQLNPHMAYYLRGAALGREDAYGRVFDGEHRPLVKEAFNAMMQASTPLLRKPDGIDLSEVEFDWPTLRKAVLEAHTTLADVFFQGHGNHLQFIDSCIAEKVMLQFVRSDDAPVLPVHDSFIMHYAFGDMGELEEAMRRAFHDHFKKDIKVSEEIGIILPSSFDDMEFEDLAVEEIADGPPEYSLWNRRN
tara:strand:+ start:1751 stop:3097 length:1347 start_codon:yes stop_codon:yes gene_type:complete